MRMTGVRGKCVGGRNFCLESQIYDIVISFRERSKISVNFRKIQGTFEKFREHSKESRNVRKNQGTFENFRGALKIYPFLQHRLCIPPLPDRFASGVAHQWHSTYEISKTINYFNSRIRQVIRKACYLDTRNVRRHSCWVLSSLEMLGISRRCPKRCPIRCPKRFPKDSRKDSQR
jgi:hypothetical protein